MNTKTIYIIRHGETEYNRQGIVQGSGIDADLNETGKAQAQAFFEYYQHLPFDKIYISNLKRTQQSVQKFIDLGIPYEKFEGLNEISWGIQEGKTPNADDNRFYLDLIGNWKNGNTKYAPEEGEHPEEVADRQKIVLQEILSRKDEKLILIAMHGRALRILLTQLLNRPLHKMDDFEHSNLCLYKLGYDYDSGIFSVEVANDITHLSPLEA